MLRHPSFRMGAMDFVGFLGEDAAAPTDTADCWAVAAVPPPAPALAIVTSTLSEGDNVPLVAKRLNRVLTDDDIIAAMESVPDYLDITTSDFRTVYHIAYRHALQHAALTPAPASRPRNLEPPRPPLMEIMRSWIGAFIGIAAVAGINCLLFPHSASAMMIGSFGATAVLLFGAMRSPLAQPRNIIGGHILSAIVGVTCAQLLGHQPWLAEAVAVASAIALMHLTRTLHPPGGATALIAVIGSAEVHRLGYLYVLAPATVGPLAMLAVALVLNNLGAGRRYPEGWL